MGKCLTGVLIRGIPMSLPIDPNSNHQAFEEPEPERTALGSETGCLGVHPDVLKLRLVSFLTDISSEMIFSVFAFSLRQSLAHRVLCWV